MKIRTDFVTNSSSSSFIIMGKEHDDMKLLYDIIEGSGDYDTEVETDIETIKSYLGKEHRRTDEELYDALEDNKEEYDFYFKADIGYHTDVIEKLMTRLGLKGICTC